MPQLSSLVFIHLIENDKTEEEAKAIMSDVNKIMLLDSGKGAVIKTWNVSDVIRPTQMHMDSYQELADKYEKNNRVIKNRKQQYKKIQEQFSMMTKDIEKYGVLDNRGEWFKHCSEVKKGNPKL